MSTNKQVHSTLDQDSATLRFLDKFIPLALSSDRSELFKARRLVLIVGIILLLSLISMLLVIVVDDTLNERRFITISLITSHSLSLCLMWWTKRTTEASWFLVLILSITIMFIDYNNLSFKGAFSIIWMLPTTVTVILLGGRATLKITTLSILGMTANFLLLEKGALPAPITPPEKWTAATFIISITIMLIVTFSVYVLAKMAKRKELELSNEIESSQKIALELEESKNLAEKAAENKTMFLATMSHELRTPLNSILGNSELLSRLELEDKAKGYVGDIYSASKLLISIINDVLDISKFDTHGIEFRNEVYDLSDQVKRIHRMMTPQVNPSVNFILKGADKPVFINADQNRLSQVILNLVSNAAKFTSEGEITLSLIQLANHQVIIEVKDTGIGISKEDAKDLFNDFVQVRKSANQQVEGTGLGLAISQRIIHRMSGKINLDSIEGKGSTFSIELPTEVLDLSASNDKDLLHSTSPHQEDFSQLNILIVDDVPMNCLILSALLKELGIENIVKENDGQEAVDRLQQDKCFDMILMDIRMPKMDGLEATKQIRALGYTKPIIAVTANAFEEDKKACLDIGMTDFLSKPIDIASLKDVIHTNLESKKA